MPFLPPEKPITPIQQLKMKAKKETLDDKFARWFSSLSPVTLKDKLFFVQHLGIMFKAGISILVAFRILAEQAENKHFAAVLQDIATNIEQGVSLTNALKKHPKIFNELFTNMIESGEMSGKLDEVLKHLYLQMKKQYELTSKVKSALTYPVIILTAMVGIAIFMMVYVIPKIMAVFKDYDTQLPLPTRMLITVSDFLSNNWLLSLIVFGLIALFSYRLLKTERGKYYYQALILRLPIIGPIVKKINLARFARTSGSLLKTNVMIVDAFRVTASTLGNLHYRKAVMEISEKVKKGGQINEVIKSYPKFFPPVIAQMVTVGEQTGEIDNILSDLAEFYEEEVNQVMDNLPSIIEPLLILALGVGVGSIAVAVVMPIYSLTSAV